MASLVATFTAADASAAVKTARFKITVSGRQTTNWTLDNTMYDGCIQGYTRQSGSGAQSFSFKSTKAATGLAARVGRSTVFTVITGRTTPGARVKGSVSRSGQVTSQQLSGTGPGCGSGGGGGPAPTPDCGKRHFSGTVGLEWTTPAEWPGGPPVPLVPVLLLQGPQMGTKSFSTMYQDCPPGGPDQIIPTVNSALTAKKLFGRAKRFTIRGKDSDTTDQNGFHSETKVSWVAKFTRIKGAFKPPKPPTQPQCSDGRDNNGNGKIDYPQDPGCSSPTDNSE
jgi:hypothetical protein